MKNPNEMNHQRRAFLQSLSQAVGFAAATTVVAGSGMSVAFAYTPKPDSASRPGLLFSKVQMQILRDICDTVLPATDTKSAAQVDCHGFVDHQLVQCHSQHQQQMCIDAVELVNANAKLEFGNAFSQLNNKQRIKVLVEIEGLTTATQEQKRHFSFLKSLIVFGFFTSEEGITKATNFQPFPGGFKGSIPLTADTKAWGSLNYY
jgi:hypothetical protein